MRKGIHNMPGAKGDKMPGAKAGETEEDALQGETVDEKFEIGRFLDKQLRYNPTPAETRVMDQIEARAEEYIDQIYGDAGQAIHRFYATVRVPIKETINGELVDKRNNRGEILYQQDEHGRYIEDWSKLDGNELEGMILTFQRVIYYASDEVSRLWNQAMFAQKTDRDRYYQAYRDPISGAQEERRAYALRETRDSHFHFFFKYWVWKRMSDKLDTLEKITKSLEFFRQRGIKTGMFE